MRNLTLPRVGVHTSNMQGKHAQCNVISYHAIVATCALCTPALCSFRTVLSLFLSI